MTRSDLAREQTQRLLGRVLRVLDKALLRLAPEQLDFRPTPTSMTARQLAHHVYEMVLMCYRGAELGALARADLDFLHVEAAGMETAHELVVWGDRVKDYARRVADELTDAKLDATVRFHFGLETTGWEALRTATEEALHHRGQLLLYLRLAGVDPPRVNDYG